MDGHVGSFDARLQQLMSEGLTYKEATANLAEQLAAQAWARRKLAYGRRLRSMPQAKAPREPSA